MSLFYHIFRCGTSTIMTEGDTMFVVLNIHNFLDASFWFKLVIYFFKLNIVTKHILTSLKTPHTSHKSPPHRPQTPSVPLYEAIKPYYTSLSPVRWNE